MSFREINCKILQKKYPGLSEQIFENEKTPEHKIAIQTAASGVPTATVNGLYVHSPRDPEREGRRIAESIVPGGGFSPLIFLGFGLGYTATAVADAATPADAKQASSGPVIPIIIVEKNIDMLRKAFELRDLSRFLSREGIAFVPGDSVEGVTRALSHFEKINNENNTPVVIRNPTLTGVDEEWYGAVENRIRAWTMRDEVNAATKKKFGRRWIRNLTRNMDAIRDLPGISRLEGVAAGDCAVHGGAASGDPLPVFLAAAGPGLDEVLPLLPEIYKRCIVVAVDTSLRFLLRNGTEPDFALVVDPQFWNSCHLNRCASGRTRLIAESAVYPPVLRLPFKGMYLCGSLFPLGEFIERRVDPKGSLGAGGSVTTTAWDFSRTLGTREIWIAGLDLAFPNQKTHFKGALFEEKALAESARLKPAETWLYNTLRGGVPFTAPSISGGQVLTDRRLSLYATWFENSFRRYPFIRNYSLSSGNLTAAGGLTTTGGLTGETGLAITGLEPAGTQALLALPERREEINRRLETAFSLIETDFFNPEETRRRCSLYEKAALELRSGLEKIKTACKNGETIASGALKHNPAPAERGKILAALDKINRSITGSEVKEIAGFLFPAEAVAAIAAPEQAGDPEDSFQNYLVSSVKLYRALAEAAESS